MNYTFLCLIVIITAAYYLYNIEDSLYYQPNDGHVAMQRNRAESQETCLRGWVTQSLIISLISLKYVFTTSSSPTGSFLYVHLPYFMKLMETFLAVYNSLNNLYIAVPKKNKKYSLRDFEISTMLKRW